MFQVYNVLYPEQISDINDEKMNRIEAWETYLELFF